MTDFAKVREAAAAKVAQELQTILNGVVKHESGSFSVTPLVDAALSAFSAAGWELVPREATERMANDDAASDPITSQSRVPFLTAETLSYIWNRMIAAAIAERQK